MVEEKGPDRAERRRQKKEGKSECTQCEHGPCEIAPRVFTKCPVCGCPARFVVEAIKGDLHLEDILGKEPALFGFEYHYDTPNCKVKLMAVGASCARCGVFYTSQGQDEGLPWGCAARWRPSRFISSERRLEIFAPVDIDKQVRIR